MTQQMVCHLHVTVAPEYMAALAQLTANFQAIAELHAANQKLLLEFLKPPLQIVNLPLENAQGGVSYDEEEATGAFNS